MKFCFHQSADINSRFIFQEMPPPNLESEPVAPIEQAATAEELEQARAAMKTLRTGILTVVAPFKNIFGRSEILDVEINTIPEDGPAVSPEKETELTNLDNLLVILPQNNRIAPNKRYLLEFLESQMGRNINGESLDRSDEARERWQEIRDLVEPFPEVSDSTKEMLDVLAMEPMMIVVEEQSRLKATYGEVLNEAQLEELWSHLINLGELEDAEGNLLLTPEELELAALYAVQLNALGRGIQIDYAPLELDSRALYQAQTKAQKLGWNPMVRLGPDENYQHQED